MPWYMIAIFLGTLTINSIAMFMENADRRNFCHSLCFMGLAWGVWIIAMRVFSDTIYSYH